jgi:dTMP kinase
MKRGRMITIEGIDGAGKTTLAAGLLDALMDRGLDVRLLREPGGVPAAERIRELVIDPDLHVTSRTEALLYAAARAQLVEEAIEPLLAAGTWVLLDRFIDSSLAYQGGGRRLGIDAVRTINDFAIRTARPDRTLLLLIEPRVGRGRSRSRAGAPDRLEREHDDFFELPASEES